MTEKTRLYLRSTARIGQLLGGLCMYSAAACAQTPPLEAGVWLDDSGTGAIEIYVCADRADRLCGRIVWLKEPLNAQGVPKRDRYNPKESLQTRPICGLPVLGNLAKDSEGGFDGGWIYDPKAGKSYNAALQLARQDRLSVTGYLGMKFLGKSFVWTRAPADLQRCDSAAASQGINAANPRPGQPKPAPSSTSAKSPSSNGAAALTAPAASPPAPRPAVGTAAAAPPAAKPATTAAKPPLAATAPAPKAAVPKAAAASGSAAKVSSTATAGAAKAATTAKPVTSPPTASKPAAATATAKSTPATATAATNAQPATTPAASKPAKTAEDTTSDSNPIPAPFSWGGN